MELSGLGSRRARHGSAVQAIGRASIKCGNRTSGVAEVDIPSGVAPRRAGGVVGAQADFFIFERTPRPVDEGAVALTTTTVHADQHLVDPQRLYRRYIDEVCALISAKSLGAANAPQRPPSGHRRRIPLAAYRRASEGVPLGELVDDGDEVKKLTSHGDVGDGNDPDLVRSIDSHLAQPVQEGSMIGLRLAGAFSAVKRLDPHASNERRDPHSADPPPPKRERVTQNSSAVERQIQMQLVDPAYCAEVRARGRRGSVTHGTSRQTQQLDSADARQLLRALHQRLRRGPCKLSSAEAGISFSRGCCPILACTSLNGCPSCFGEFPGAKTSAAPEISRDSDCVFWFGSISKCSADSVHLTPPFKAARVTVALKAGEWFYRGPRDISAPGSRQYLYVPEQTNRLIRLATFPGSSYFPAELNAEQDDE